MQQQSIRRGRHYWRGLLKLLPALMVIGGLVIVAKAPMNWTEIGLSVALAGVAVRALTTAHVDSRSSRSAGNQEHGGRDDAAGDSGGDSGGGDGGGD